MTTQVDQGPLSLVASEAIARYLRVKIDSNGEAAIAGLADRCNGVNSVKVAADDHTSVRIWGAHPSYKCIAAGAIAKGALVYTAAGGKVDDLSPATSYLVGRAKTEATADGDVIEIVPVLTGPAETS